MSSSLNIPLEELLSSGGDTRLEIDRKSGRNRYGCLARPGAAVPFGSCTSSTVSPRGFKAAGETQQMFCQANNPFAAANDYADNVRGRLRDLLTLPTDVDIALAPSGTDIELLALALAAGTEGRRVMNIVVGPIEIGSGSPLAAACCHYDCLTPSGRQVVTGLPIDTALASRVSVRTVDLRALGGEMLSESEIDTAVIELVIEATEQDAIVLLHVVAHSKTGMHAPSLPCVDRLRQISDDIVVVVDAAQGRFSRRGLRDALQKDYLVMFTGSKFYGGPPFSGALLVPPKQRPAARGLDRLPARFGDYFSAVEMPKSWTQIRSHLPADPNYAALLRWSAALAEIDAYYRVPSELRLRVLRYFESEVPRVLSGSEAIRMLPVFSPLYDDTADRLLESKTTVFSFWVTPPGTRQSLGKEALKKMHVDLTTDASATCEGVDREIAARKFHIGQPVDLGDAGCVLRIALGGELIVSVATDASLGESLDERLEWLERQLVGLRQKIECLAKRHAPSRPTTTSSRDRETLVFDYGQMPNEPFATT